MSPLRRLLLVGCAAVVALGLVLLGCAALYYFALQIATDAASSAMQTLLEPVAQSVATEFVADLAAGDADAAYERTSSHYRKSHSSKLLQEILDKNVVLKKSTAKLQSFETVPGRAVYSFSLDGDNGQGSCTVTVIQEGSLWKVNQFTIP